MLIRAAKKRKEPSTGEHNSMGEAAKRTKLNDLVDAALMEVDT